MVKGGHRRFWTIMVLVLNQLWFIVGRDRLAPDHLQVDPGYNAESFVKPVCV